MLDALLSDNTQWFGDCLLENASLFCIDVYLYAVKSSSDMIDTNRKKKKNSADFIYLCRISLVSYV